MHPILEIIINLITITLKGGFDFVVLLFGGVPESKQKSKGSASLMSGFQVRRLLSVWNKGITINGKERLTEKDSTAHCLILGQSSSGKTSSVIIPTILNTKSNFIITDVDGSIFSKTSGKLKKDDYRIQVYNLGDLMFSEFFNSVFYCDNDDSKLKQLAELIIEIAFPKAMEGSASFWNFGAIQAIYIILKVLKNSDEKYKNLANVRFLLQRFHDDATRQFVSENADQDTWNEYLAFTSSEDSVLSNHITTALVALDRYGESDIASSMAKNTLSFQSLVEDERSCVFIIVPERLLNHYRGVLSLLYTSFFNYVQEHKPVKTLYTLLDEFGHLTIPNFDIISSTLRRYNVSLTIVLQDLAQLNARYGNHSSSIIFNGSFATKILFPGMPVSLARDLSQRFGKTSIKDENGMTTEKDLLSVSDLIQTPNEHSLMIHKNFPAHILKMHPYFKNYKLKRLSKIAPFELEPKELLRPELIPLNPNQDER
jgi:type IV secretory pathway TraG/TraD family ATPase VirD4